MIKKLFFLSAIIVLVLPGCHKESGTNWNTDLLVPIANTNLNLQNLIKDSTNLKTNPDKSLTLAYNSSLYTLHLADSAVNIPDTSIGKKFTLDSLTLPNIHINYGVSLGTLAQTMAASSDFATHAYGVLLLARNGTSTVVPPIPNVTVGSFPFDAGQFFDSATLVQGEIQIWVVNKFPVDISGALLTLRNVGDPNPIATYTMPYDTANDSVYFVIPLAGKHITSHMEIGVTNLSSPGSGTNSVLIDTSDNIELKMFIFNLHPAEAWAKFSSQNVLDQTEEVSQNIKDRKLTYVDAQTGFLHVNIVSTVQEYLYLEYSLIGAFDHYGHPLVLNTTVPPATPGSPSVVDSLLNISGYAINLTGVSGTKFNTYTQRVVARIDSSGFTRHISLTDGINVKYEITKVQPHYVKGYMGRDTISAIDSASFTFLSMFKSGTIGLENVNMNLDIENGLGIDGVVKINRLTAISPVNGSKNLTSPLIGQPQVIKRATDFPLRPSSNQFSFGSNSNIKDLLGILPTKISYDIQVNTNVNGNTQQYRDFAYLESGLNVNLSAEIPLSIFASHLLLKDTIAFDLRNATTNVNGITDGVINVISENKYPIEPLLTMVIYDSTWNAIDTLLLNTKVDAGSLDANCKVESPARTKIPLTVTQARMDNLKHGRNAVITADFSTPSANGTCNSQYLKIYSDYNLGITFTAKFNYTVNTKL